jgi:hypothetical protein
MSFQSLDLETVTLADPNEKLTLAVKTKANLKVEETTLSPSNKVTFDALALGKFWVWSGTACCLEIEVLVDGQPLHQDSRLHFLEILGGQICDQDVGLAFPSKSLLICESCGLLYLSLQRSESHPNHINHFSRSISIRL